ncbi:MAG: hypothetical protein HOJ35_10825 [Bdellovibrionales bacterium]|jgi:hypothetical protein|nr:hypothetical protein [Bdellovibrionales bacterium]
MKKITLICLLLLLTFNVVAKTIIMPSDFLGPIVTLSNPDSSEETRLDVSGIFYYGARTPERAIKVKLDYANFDQETSEFTVHLTGTNRGPWMNFVNIAILNNKKLIGFSLLNSAIISNNHSKTVKVKFSFSDICKNKLCNFQDGVIVYFYLNPKLNRTIHPIYVWDNIVGAYYNFKL